MFLGWRRRSWMWRLPGMRRNDDDATKTRKLGYLWLPMDDD
jgi:hypothetical protein